MVWGLRGLRFWVHGLFVFEVHGLWLVFGSRFGVQGLGFRVWGLEFGAQGAGFFEPVDFMRKSCWGAGTWGLGFGIWSQGLRVQGFGFRVGTSGTSMTETESDSGLG
jgi:hypothetical protein